MSEKRGTWERPEIRRCTKCNRRYPKMRKKAIDRVLCPKCQGITEPKREVDSVLRHCETKDCDKRFLCKPTSRQKYCPSCTQKTHADAIKEQNRMPSPLTEMKIEAMTKPLEPRPKVKPRFYLSINDSIFALRRSWGKKPY